jgi:two-component system CheB/CheR fusion protein
MNPMNSQKRINKKSPTTINASNVGERYIPIVGIGASAGGLEALELFFRNMPSNNGMAFVVIQHLDPTQPGIMPELLQRITGMDVFQAIDPLQVKANSVYVIPPNKSLSILNGTLHLFDPIEARGLRLPIDIFFKSLADDMQDKSIGIILSGMGSDGSLGLKAIKEKNGKVLVQDPDTAKFDSMPRSAIEVVTVDIVATADELPLRLIELLNFIPEVIPELTIDIKDQSNIDKIIILLRDKTGHDFSLYKKNTLFRRIERRKAVHLLDNTQNYVRFLQENPKELEILLKDLLIGVTGFFRDTAVWKKLKEKILPNMIDELPNNYVIRVWIPACSTGEEAYTLAMSFIEVLDSFNKNKNITMQIFATDIDADAIEIARKGIFLKSNVSEVSTERLNRFFIAEGDGYRVNSLIREMIVFAPQNIIKDPPFTRLDILTCRNMLIYMESELQKKLITLFNYSLKLGGILLLGTAETLGTKNEGFDEIDSRLKIYRRSVSINTSIELIDFPSSFYRHKTIATIKNTETVTSDTIQTITDNIIIQRFAPASVLVNKKGDILYVTGRTGKYLEPLAGKANWNIHAMAREGLRHELHGAFRKALKNYDPVLLPKIRIENNGGNLYVNVTLQSIDVEALRGMVIVVFNDVMPDDNDTSNDTKIKKRASTSQQKEMELEFQRIFEELQSTREEMQTSQEELKSTNEELQSSNEELQSSNEELTTSKEEMQSLNEELQTVNIELQSKVNDFVQANNDMKNLLNSTEIATLFLDRDLNIRRFTDPVTHIFKLRNTDVGRPFTDLVTDLQYPDIDSHARQVLKTLTTIETPITTVHGRWFTIRIMPYRTFDDRIDGLVITFNDITIFKNLELELNKAYEALKELKS